MNECKLITLHELPGSCAAELGCPPRPWPPAPWPRPWPPDPAPWPSLSSPYGSLALDLTEVARPPLMDPARETACDPRAPPPPPAAPSSSPPARPPPPLPRLPELSEPLSEPLAEPLPAPPPSGALPRALPRELPPPYLLCRRASPPSLLPPPLPKPVPAAACRKCVGDGKASVEDGKSEGCSDEAPSPWTPPPPPPVATSPSSTSMVPTTPSPRGWWG